ncbi:MAG: 50S ribosomal protein L3 [Alphaproteobacteria bacterium]|mgnify:CR=1|nr:50S ribosomal protein L3 [Alphaproteobacteria bacterium]OJV16386.1 MAG: 50S ribosomal protein L3 [Alphaproteobacteria bacterium 33-17]
MRALKLLESNQRVRTGMIAKKLGMSTIYEQNGTVIPVTVLEIENQFVLDHKTVEKNGYNALQIACGERKAKNVSKPVRGVFAKSNLKPANKIAEFKISADAFINIGAKIRPDHFIAGQFVDITGTTIGKGFAGGMKRWNFRGLEASHGVSITHRSHGSTGQRQDPGKVFKGKKMAGHLGDSKVTIQNLQVVDVDNENSLLIVKGAVPGNAGSYVIVKDAVKKNQINKLPFPASVDEVTE